MHSRNGLKEAGNLLSAAWFMIMMFSGVLSGQDAGGGTGSWSPDSIFAGIGFENRNPGEKYGNLDVRRDFNTMLSLGTYWPFRRISIDSVDSERNRVLAVHYPKEKVRSLASGGSWKWKPFNPRQEMFFSFWVLFPDSFVFRHGGKLHGLLGGKGNTGGSKPTGHDGWSCRFHWGEGDLIKLYIYHKDQDSEWGDTFYFTENPSVIDMRDRSSIKRFGKREIHMERGRWHHLQMRVKVNAAGYSNGLAQAWYDGRLVTDVRGLELRDSTCAAEDLLVNAMYFSTFFGGRDPEYMPVKDETVLFDDFVLSRTMYRPEGMPYLDGVPE